MNTQIKPIRNEADYKEALSRIEKLMDAKPNTNEFDELEVLATLVEDYEEKEYPIAAPSPIAAIKFRMEQNNLNQADLVPYIGSKSKVSEVLSGKRELSKAMIRALHKELNIPLNSLFQESPKASSLLLPENCNYNNFPLKEMAQKGWITPRKDLFDYAEEILEAFIKPVKNISILSNCLYRRSTINEDTVNQYALFIWGVELLKNADNNQLKATYKPKTINKDFIKEIISFSPQKKGVILAKNFLASHGIHLIYLPHLSKTYLDGASLRLDDGTPVIGMTIRHDRIDNFWFTLCHELAHQELHLENGDINQVFFDNLDKLEDNDLEKEADEYASNLLIPHGIWQEAEFVKLVSDQEKIDYKKLNNKMNEVAAMLNIHPAIIAGRIRKETDNYRVLSKKIGNKEVRTLFKTI